MVDAMDINVLIDYRGEREGLCLRVLGDWATALGDRKGRPYGPSVGMTTGVSIVLFDELAVFV